MHIYIYLSGKLNVWQNVQNSGGTPLYLQTMHILIYLGSEFYDGFDGHIYNYAPHRTFGLLRVEIWGHFQKS